MNIELTIENITEMNKKEKLINMSKALSLALNIPVDINGEGIIEKARLHKYISREFKNGQWYYRYAEDRKNINGKVVVCSSQPLKVTPENAKRVGEQFLRQWEKDWQENPKKRECPALNYTKIGFGDISFRHLSTRGKQGKQKGQKRDVEELIERASMLPFAKEILEGKNKGIVSEVRNDEKTGLVYYEIWGQAVIHGKKETISVIISKKKPDSKKYISVIKKAVSKILQRDSFKKWYAMDDGLLHQHSNKRMASLGQISERIMSSFQPSLPNIASFENQSNYTESLLETSKNIKRFPNIILQMENVNNANKYEKLTKAIKAVASQLELPVGVEESEKPKAKCIYPIQEELLKYWTIFYARLLEEVYLKVTEVFDLPSISSESLKKSNDLIMQKANNKGAEYIINPLKYNGKIIYNADTGKPISKKDFDAFIKAIEVFLNKNTKDTGKRITLDNVAISKILKRLAQCSTTKKMDGLTLSNLKVNEKSFEWIRSEYKHLSNALGEPLTSNEIARYQVCEDYATNLITRMNDDVRSDVKDVFLNGIKNKKSKSQVSQELFDKFGNHNRNWKRIVETESVNISNLASILEDVEQAEKGEKVYFKRYEAGDACPVCQSIDGVIALWVNNPLPDDKIDDDFASIALWEGKESNTKLGIIGTGTMHPHCRGVWIKWDADTFDATLAKINGKENEWNSAVETIREEYKQDGIEHPDINDFKFRWKVREKYKSL